MSVLLLITSNKKEEEILKMFFKQSSFEVTISLPNYANYVKSLQYNPHVILMEIPPKYTEFISYIRLVKRNRQTSKTPIIAYGDHQDDLIIKTFLSEGVKQHIKRPLKSNALLQIINAFVKTDSKSAAPVEKSKEEEEARDMELLLAKDKLATQKIDLMAGRINKMLAFPFTVAKVLKITQSEDSGASDLAKAIRADPVITATILKVSNSVLFATRDKRIADVKEAIVRIGFRETKNVAMSLSIIKILSTNVKSMGFDRVEFWYHSLACGIITEKIAKIAGYPVPEEAFIAGLLHDFGIILLDEFFPKLFNQIIEKTTKHGSLFIKEETNLIGVNHNDVAEKLFQNWNMPDCISFSMRQHNNFLNLEENIDKNLKILTQALGIANILSKSMQLGRGVDQYIYPVPNRVWEEMRIQTGPTEMFMEDVYNQLNLYNQFLNIDTRKFPPKEKNIKDADKTKIAFINRQSHVFSPVEVSLGREGFTVIKCRTAEEVKKIEGGVDLIILQAHIDDNREKLEPYFNLQREVGADESEQKALPWIPLLVMHDPSMDIGSFSKRAGFKLMSNHLDLRNLIPVIARFTGNMEGMEEEETTLQIEKKQLQEGFVILEMTGSFRLNSLAEARKYFVDSVAGNTKFVALNMAKLDFMDSSGIRLLVNLHKLLQKNNGKLCIIQPNNDVLKVLETNNLQKVFVIVQNEDALYDALGIKKQTETTELNPDLPTSEPSPAPAEPVKASAPSDSAEPEISTNDLDMNIKI
jgi:anti-anti-sigma factor